MSAINQVAEEEDGGEEGRKRRVKKGVKGRMNGVRQRGNKRERGSQSKSDGEVRHKGRQFCSPGDKRHQL